MFIDLRDGAAPGAFEADICIIGAGAAGIAMAVALIPSKLKVLLVESGGFEFDPDTQELYAGAIAGREYGALDTVRLRYFGGTTNHWEGYSGPLQPLDLARRDWVPLSGWPLTRADLDPFYARAHPVLDLGPYDYDATHWNERFQRFNQTLPRRFAAELWQISHPITRIGTKYRAEIEQAANITALLHANATEIALAPNGSRVDHVELRTLNGRAAAVRARAVVLACGGIENPRLLLASNAVRPDGVGNDHGWVGRCFMEHPDLREPAAALLQGDMQWAFSFKNGHEPHHHIMHLRPDDGLQREERILNVSLQMAVDLKPDPSSGYMALSRLRQGQGGWGDMFRDLGRALIDPGDIIDGMYSAYADEQYVPRLKDPALGRVRIRSEQAPNPDSRVTLGEERDALGMRRARLDWRLTELDRHTLARALEHFARETGRLGRGRMRIDDWITAAQPTWPDDLEWGYHHMGTTRMSDDPRTGVVDADCKVHGVEGLYIAGSSVFPTGGYMNPTLTIVALALRLSDHLGARLS